MREVVYKSESQLRNPLKLLRSMVRDLITSRELTWRLFVRNISTQYRQTALGYFWAVFPPLVHSLVFILLNSSNMLTMQETGVPYPVYVIMGTVFFGLFADALKAPLQMVNGAKGILIKINFPREALLLTAIGQVIFSFSIKMVLLFATLLIFWVPVYPMCLIDEVLAVGDTAFQEKCMRRMDVLRNSNKAIIFVTHSLYQVEALCNKALWLEKGRVIKYGAAGDVVRAYLDNQERRAMVESRAEGIAYQGRITAATKAYFQTMDANKNMGADKNNPARPNPTNKAELIEIRKVELLDADGNIGTEFPFLSDLTVRIKYNAVKRIHRPLFNLRFFNKDRSIFETSMLIDGYGPDWVEGEGAVECKIPRLPLTPKVYDILLFMRSSEGIAGLAPTRIVAQFRITDEKLNCLHLRGPMAVNHLRQGSPIYVPCTWYFFNGKDARV